MCGICGYIELDRRQSDRKYIKGMVETLTHRGPDGQDFYYGDYFNLGFNRLSIIGLADGMQPMMNEDESIILICNGEIFNYIELRQNLINRNHVFKTNCDVEVIIHLYEEYGKSFIQQLNGQFAFVLYDKKLQTFFCARDHFGIAPFYYTVADGTFIFGSEIKAILQHGKVKRDINLLAVDQILTFPGLLSPQTMFKNIFSLENGHYLEIHRDGEIKNVEYWDMTYPDEGEIHYKENESYYIDELKQHLIQSVKIRLRSDVKVGLYLSGGLDSSLVAGIVNGLSKETRNTFSIDFSDLALSEAKYQNIVVNDIRSLHDRKIITLKDIEERLAKAIYHCEMPLKESYDTASYALSEEANKAGIKVVLAGEGADELFGGYVGYKFDKMRQMNQTNTTDPNEAAMRQRLWGDGNLFYEKDYFAYSDVKKSLYTKNIRDSYDEINCVNYPLINKARLKNKNILHQRSYLDYKIRLVDHLVSDHGDRMAYANSVETRYPFLDKDLFEFIRIIPPELKLNGFNEKYILKEAAKGIVPQEIINREKFAFVAPGSSELLKENSEYFQSFLSQDTIKRQGIFDPSMVEQLRKKYMAKDFTLNLPFESDLLIIIITFGIFFDKFNLTNFS